MKTNYALTAVEAEVGLFLGLGVGLALQRLSYKLPSSIDQKVALLAMAALVSSHSHTLPGTQVLVAKHVINQVAIADHAWGVSEDVVEVAIKTFAFSIFAMIGTELFDCPGSFTVLGCLFNYI